MAVQCYRGSTSCFYRLEEGVLLKYPVQIRGEGSSRNIFIEKIGNNFSVERQILNLLGQHPRIVP
jgi:hypothetical protein